MSEDRQQTQTEKTTERIAFEYLTGNGIKYNQNKNRELFGEKMPDGWKLLNLSLLILEFKKDDKDKNAAAKQLFAYYRLAQTKKPELKEVFGIIITGTSPEGLRVYAYKFSPNKMAKINVNEVFSVFSDINADKFKYVRNSQTIHNNLVKNFKYDSPQELGELFTIILTSSLNDELVEIYEKKNEKDVLANDFKRLLIDNAKQYIENAKTYEKYFQLLINTEFFKVFDICKTIHFTCKYNRNAIKELLNQFNKYTKTASEKNEVWTEKPIAELMLSLLKPFCREILENGQKLSVLDPCIGGGGLVRIILDEFKENLEKITIYGCDVVKRFILSNILIYLNTGINNKLFPLDFMEVPAEKLLSDICICNPPYSKNISHYFASEFLEHATECAAVCCFIFPESNFNLNNCAKLTEARDNILKRHNVLTVLRLGKNIFKGIGAGEIIIMLTQKRTTPGESSECKIYDLSALSTSEYYKKIIRANEYELTEKGRALIDKFENGELSYTVQRLEIGRPWFVSESLEISPREIIAILLERRANEIKAKIAEDLAEIRERLAAVEILDEETGGDNTTPEASSEARKKKQLIRLLNNEFKRLKVKKFKRYKLADLFEPIQVKRYGMQKEEPGEIPLFGATNKNKPVKFIKNISYTVTEEEKGQIVTINKNGSGAGYCFRKDLGPFSVIHDVNCYRLKRPLTDEDLDTISIQLNKIFNFHHNLNVKRFFDTYVYLFDDEAETIEENPETFNPSEIAEELKEYFNELNSKKWIKYALSDLFEPIQVKRYGMQKEEPGEIPLFGATNKNKPVKFIKNISYTVTEEEKGQIVTINKNGSAGYCFRKDLGPFSITHDVNCYRLKRPLTDEDLDTISIQLNKILDFSKKLNNKRFFELYVYLFE